VTDTTFHCMGSQVRLLDVPAEDARRERDFLEGFARRLSRFEPDSELCALNRDPREEVPASRLLRTAVSAGLWAAECSGGLVDPTLTDALVRAGYGATRAGVAPAALAEALVSAPARRPAGPDPRGCWRAVSVDDARGTIRRPPGVALDTGGTGKGLAADAVAHRLSGHARFVVDCGGDIAVRGAWDVAVEHPLTGERAHTLHVRDGGVATSGINVRVWRRADGSFAHHLLDPSTGEPAWTGLIAATAVGATALEAETRSKLALLSGPDGARRVLARSGGVLVHDSGDVELVGSARRVTLRLAA
jgi:thiamine biosynthesis lipoprotein